MKTIFRIFTLFLIISCASGRQFVSAQEVHFMDTVKSFNRSRLVIDTKGMQVLAGSGIVSMVSGGIGVFTAKQEEWKYFHEMNIAWGAVNTTIAVFGFSGIKKQAKEKLVPQKAYASFQSDKKVYLINIGLDALYVAAGAGLVQYAKSNTAHQAMLSGFGKSIVVQGVFLLCFDNVMYASHLRYNHRWLRLIDEMKFTGTGFTFNYMFPTHHINY